MKSLILLVIVFGFVSCAHESPHRSVSSEDGSEPVEREYKPRFEGGFR